MSDRNQAGTPSFGEVLLQDPLQPVTRKERLYLLAVSTVGLFIEYTGLVPTKVSALGIEFGKTNQNALLYVLALIILYFLVAFILYATADFFARQAALRAASYADQYGPRRGDSPVGWRS